MNSTAKVSNQKESKGKTLLKSSEFPTKLEIDEEIPKGGRPFNAAAFGQMAARGFTKLYQSEDLTDITLVLGDQKIKTHRTVLCVWSDTFRAMLENQDRWAESRLKELPIEVLSGDYESFKHLIHYMYTGEVNFITSENIISVLELANYYGVLSLKECCGDILSSIISEETLLYLLEICDRYACHSLEASCGEYLAENFQSMLESGRLSVLDPSIWAEMIKSDELKISCEEKLFAEVLRYCEQFKSDRKRWESVLELLLPHVRFPLFPGKNLVELVEGNPDIADLPLVHKLVHEAYRYKAYPASVSNERTKPRKGFQWDNLKCPTAIEISENGLKASMPSINGWYNVKTQQPLTSSSNYIEIKLEAGVNVMFGAVLGSCQDTGYAGQYANGWTYYTNGQLYHAAGTPKTGTVWKIGDKVGMLMDFEKEKLHFFVNGALSMVVENINTKSSEQLYACINFSSAPSTAIIVPNASPPEGDFSKGPTITRRGNLFDSSDSGSEYSD